MATHAEQWQIYYQALIEYKEEYGNVLVPKNKWFIAGKALKHISKQEELKELYGDFLSKINYSWDIDSLLELEYGEGTDYTLQAQDWLIDNIREHFTSGIEGLRETGVLELPEGPAIDISPRIQTVLDLFKGWKAQGTWYSALTKIKGLEFEHIKPEWSTVPLIAIKKLPADLTPKFYQKAVFEASEDDKNPSSISDIKDLASYLILSSMDDVIFIFFIMWLLSCSYRGISQSLRRC